MNLQSTDLCTKLEAIVEDQPYPLLFMTISGAHMYGFASADSDYDLRGVHLLPASEVVGLQPGHDTIEVALERDALEIDLVTHDAFKFFGLLLKRNGYVLEQLFSPLVLKTSAEHDELKQIAQGCLTSHHANHYLGFAETQMRLLEKSWPWKIKPLLYIYRVLLTGIFLMRTEVVEANLPRLNQEFKLLLVDDLIARKVAGTEGDTIDDADTKFHRDAFELLKHQLEDARQHSRLPAVPSAMPALNELLIRLRLRGDARF